MVSLYDNQTGRKINSVIVEHSLPVSDISGVTFAMDADTVIYARTELSNLVNYKVLRFCRRYWNGATSGAFSVKWFSYFRYLGVCLRFMRMAARQRARFLFDMSQSGVGDDDSFSRNAFPCPPPWNWANLLPLYPEMLWGFYKAL